MAYPDEKIPVQLLCNTFSITQNLLVGIFSKFAMHYIIEEIDEDTSMEDLQKK